MKRYSLRGVGKYLDGYTLIEVMIFLAVSGALLVSAMTFISGRQERVRYTQAVVEFEQQLQDTLNDVSTGYYPTNSDYTCTYNDSYISFDSDDRGQGSNEQCIFAGKLIHFFPNDEPGDYVIYTIVGPQSARTINDTPNIPPPDKNGKWSVFRMLGAPGASARYTATPGIAETKHLGADIQFTKNPDFKPDPDSKNLRQLIDSADPSGTKFHSFAIIPEFQGSGPGNSVTGNASKVKLYGYESQVDAKPLVANFKEIKGSLIICMRQDGTGRPSALVITKQLTIERWIDKQPDLCKI